MILKSHFNARYVLESLKSTLYFFSHNFARAEATQFLSGLTTAIDLSIASSFSESHEKEKKGCAGDMETHKFSLIVFRDSVGR